MARTMIAEVVFVSPLYDEAMQPRRRRRRRNAMTPRYYNVYQEQICMRSKLDDLMWRTTTSDLARLHTLRLLYQEQQVLDNKLFALALVTIAVEIISIELYWSTITSQWSFAPLNVVKTLGSFLVLITLALLCARYGTPSRVSRLMLAELDARIEVWTHRLRPSTKLAYAAVQLLRAFLVEFFILALHLPPGLDYTFQVFEYVSLANLNPSMSTACATGLIRFDFKCYKETSYSIHQFGMLTATRIYLFSRFLRNQSGFTNSLVKLLGSLHNIDAMSPWFSRKYMFRTHPILFTCGMLLWLWFVVSVSVSHSERATTNTNLGTYYDALWFTIVTMTTVGFGDCTVVGDPGRVICVVAVAGGILVIALCRVVTKGIVALNPAEEDVIRTIHGRQRHVRVAHLAASLLQLTWRRYRVLQRPSTAHKARPLCLEICRRTIEARAIRLKHTRGGRHKRHVLRKCFDHVHTAVTSGEPLHQTPEVDVSIVLAKLTVIMHALCEPLP
ncbi:Aste57867_19449 [Aphanomyces stellatus]|uniref:Aste57867_19449 protein n=1 Tax=Aphanomyces stellatus TaxID=120398 RepID=A0A485LH25_9STRA|nr:hypothetical protein As57867_019385 [Aphanomyces stellatus]VFT96162.1 Aste57867_19449 [Aphanomyces stellatus]